MLKVRYPAVNRIAPFFFTSLGIPVIVMPNTGVVMGNAVSGMVIGWVGYSVIFRGVTDLFGYGVIWNSSPEFLVLDG